MRAPRAIVSVQRLTRVKQMSKALTSFINSDRDLEPSRQSFDHSLQSLKENQRPTATVSSVAPPLSRPSESVLSCCQLNIKAFLRRWA